MKKYEDSMKESKKKIMKSSKKKIGKSSSHLKKRLNKWMNESNRGNIVIETLTHPLENNKALVSLRQFRMNEDTKKKSKVGDLMVIHSDNLNLFIKRLQEIKDNLSDNMLNGIIVDEWHINSEQSKLRKELSEFAAEEIRILYWPVAKETCYACEINEPSQRRHQCCQEPQKNLSLLFDQLIKRINWSKFPEESGNIDVETLLDDDEWYKNTIDLSCKNCHYINNC